MKVIFKIISMLSVLLIVIGCATTSSKQTVYQSIPSINVNSERGWDIVQRTIMNYYPSIEYANKKTGEIRSVSYVIDKCWAGLAYGGFVPCKTEALIARVLSQNPFEVEFAVKQRKGTPMSNYRNWIDAGNNTKKEEIIYQDLLVNLNLPSDEIPSFPTSLSENNNNEIVFERLSKFKYKPARLDNLLMYKSINHFEGLDDDIIKDEVPKKEYEVLGVLKLNKNWYYSSFMEYLLKTKLEEIGGDAILKYETYQSESARMKREDTGKIDDVYLMSIEATVIKFKK